ncbi:MAG: SH3 domain-containing protein [Gammaproteobacteria bacterium]|nr:SH3 domain-containing protein [Gammaproteobacteria bacterium]
MRWYEFFLTAILTVTLLAGCAAGKRDEAAPVSDVGIQNQKISDSDQRRILKENLRNQLAEKNRELDQLRLRLLVEQSRIKQLMLSLARVEQRAERADARLRSLDNRAETVAVIAEATLVVSNAGEQVGGERSEAVIAADELLSKSRKELQAGNLQNASRLAAEAVDRAQPTASLPGGAGQQFAVPLTMTVKKTSNVRESPGNTSKALLQLPEGARVTALGYRGVWIRVVVGNREGWIYYKLLEVVDSSGPQNRMPE